MPTVLYPPSPDGGVRSAGALASVATAKVETLVETLARIRLEIDRDTLAELGRQELADGQE